MVNPPSYADIRLCVGEQRSGKSTTLVAYAVEDYFKKMTGLSKLDEKGNVISSIKAECLTESDKKILLANGIKGNKLSHCRIFSDDGRSTIIKIPNDYIVESPVKIFAILHLYGIRYVYISIVDIIQYLNTDVFNNAWILADETVMNDVRNSMTAMGKLMATFGSTIGKQNAKLCLATQLNEMVERRFRAFATTIINCSYDENTRLINVTIKKRGEDEFETDFYEPQYRKFFKSTEKPKIPDVMIDRALAKFYKV